MCETEGKIESGQCAEKSSERVGTWYSLWTNVE